MELPGDARDPLLIRMDHSTLPGKSPARHSLALLVLARLLTGLLLISCLLFIPAGTLVYWEAWLYIGVLFLSLAIYGIVLLLKDPQLLERRVKTQESEGAQKKAIFAASVLILAVYLVAGFDQRFGWSDVPAFLVIAATGVIQFGFLLFVLTIRENRFASRVVEIQDQQTVVKTGPYAIVRHPMYLAFSLVYGFTPLALGSWWALVPAFILPLVMAARLQNEEQLLLEKLPGYHAYCQEVEYRLLPFIW